MKMCRRIAGILLVIAVVLNSIPFNSLAVKPKQKHIQVEIIVIH